jgi:hypothetical protein
MGGRLTAFMGRPENHHLLPTTTLCFEGGQHEGDTQLLWAGNTNGNMTYPVPTMINRSVFALLLEGETRTK